MNTIPWLLDIKWHKLCRHTVKINQSIQKLKLFLISFEKSWTHLKEKVKISKTPWLRERYVSFKDSREGEAFQGNIISRRETLKTLKTVVIFDLDAWRKKNFSGKGRWLLLWCDCLCGSKVRKETQRISFFIRLKRFYYLCYCVISTLLLMSNPINVKPYYLMSKPTL